MELFKRLLEFVKPYWLRLFFAMLCMVGVSMLTAALAYLVKPALDKLFFEKDSVAPVLIPLRIEDVSMLHLIPLCLVLVYLFKGIFDYGQAYLMSYVGQRIITDMRDRLYHHIQTLSLSFMTKTPTGVLISRITNDVNLMQGVVSTAVSSVLRDAFTIFGLIGVVFYRDWKLASLAFIVFPIVVFPIVRFGRKLRKVSTRGQSIMGSLTTLLHESISGSRIVKAFGMEEYENNKFSNENSKLFRTIMKSHKVRALSSPVMELIGGVGSAFVIWYGSYCVMKGYTTPGNFFSFLTGLLMLYRPIKSLSRVNNTIQQGLAAAERVFEILDTEPEIKNRKNAVTLDPGSKTIEFNGVSFKYDEELVLQDIHLKVNAGEAVALVGMSGGGKTTLVNLIPRFYDISGGEILINGVDIRDATIESLRSQIAIVTQQTILFNDTIRNNIGYGDINKREEEIVGASKAANAHAFVMETPMGYDSIILSSKF